MVIAAVMVVNAFHGISTSAWTGWVWFAVSIGVILIWIYTVRGFVFCALRIVLTPIRHLGCILCYPTVEFPSTRIVSVSFLISSLVAY